MFQYQKKRSSRTAAYFKLRSSSSLGIGYSALRNGKVDALFIVAGYPTGALVELASAADMKLVPIDGDGAAALTEKYGFFAASDIPEAFQGNAIGMITAGLMALAFMSFSGVQL